MKSNITEVLLFEDFSLWFKSNPIMIEDFSLLCVEMSRVRIDNTSVKSLSWPAVGRYAHYDNISILLAISI